ncbi:hypothetical protein CQW23_33610 [Capsicum baccatum]|uniref:Uncharacterized protein n=1 Tax=Capsicum baccatum TaxID=33114 RepID=A0A2G2V1A1_CAPBA|nr:hypothetical protein CQW23_33610 [Capsicum baccatum]
MTIKDAVKTNILSTRWRYMVASMLTLQFSLDMFGINYFRSFMSALLPEKFLEVVNQFLQLYLGHKVVELEMNTFILRKFSSEFGQLMHSVSKLGVERLHLNFSCGKIPTSKYINLHRNTIFEFSLELLSQASSLKSLFLSVCVVQPSVTLRLNSLKTLFLMGVLLETGQLEVTSVLFADCGGLEEIDLQATKLHEFECFFNNRDNIDELVSPVTSVRNDSAGTNPDKISTIKPRSMSNGNKVLPYYRSSPSTSSYNVGNTKRKLSSEAKPWHPLSKRKNKLPANEQSPARTLVGEAKKGTLVKQKLSTPPGSVLGEKKKVTGVEKKPSTSPGSMLGEEKKRTVVMQKTSTTSRSNQSDVKKGILVNQKLSTPPVNILEEGKKVNEVYQKTSSPQESVLKDEKEVTMVEQKPFSPPGCMEGGIDEVTMVEQKYSASLVSMLGEGENVAVVEQNLFTPSGSMLVEGKKEAMVNQKPSAPPGSMLGQGKKLNVVNQRPSPKDQNMMRRDGTNKLNLEIVPEKTLRTPKLKASPKSSSYLQSRPLSNKEDKKEVVKPADSALVKLKFRRGKIADLHQETSSPRRLTFRWGRHMGESQDSNTRKRIFKNKGVVGEKSNTIPISGKIVLRHQYV